MKKSQLIALLDELRDQITELECQNFEYESRLYDAGLLERGTAAHAKQYLKRLPPGEYIGTMREDGTMDPYTLTAVGK